MVDLERRIVHYSGTVQGVGFRYTTLDVARGYRVTGYVKNLDDGRVELVAEGGARELDSFLKAILDSGVGRFVDDADEAKGPASGDLGKGFSIRY